MLVWTHKWPFPQNTAPGDFRLKLTGLYFGSGLSNAAAVAVVVVALDTELFEANIFDVFALAFRFPDDPFNPFCCRSLGEFVNLLISSSIINGIFY